MHDSRYCVCKELDSFPLHGDEVWAPRYDFFWCQTQPSHLTPLQEKGKTQNQYEAFMGKYFRQALGSSVTLSELLTGDGTILRKGGDVDRTITYHDPLWLEWIIDGLSRCALVILCGQCLCSVMIFFSLSLLSLMSFPFENANHLLKFKRKTRKGKCRFFCVKNLKG